MALLAPAGGPAVDLTPGAAAASAPTPTPGGTAVPPEAADAPAADAPSQPFRFERNLGQWPEGVLFAARGGAPASLLADGLLLPGGVHLAWGAAVDVAPASHLPAVSHYLHGNDPSRWVLGVPHAASVRYAGVAPGVDVLVHGTADGHLEFDHVLAPGADPAAVALRVTGATARLQADGTLRLEPDAAGARAAWTLEAPVAYQEGPAGREPVASAFRVARGADGAALVGYDVGAYDAARPLVIDPIVRYSSLVGVFQRDYADAVAVHEPAGSPAVRRVYVGGTSDDIDNGAGIVYPVPFVAPGNATRISPTATTGVEGWLARFDYTIPSRTMVPVWFAYFGGSSSDRVLELDVNAAGDIAVAGATTGNNFPTLNPVQVATPAYDGGVYQGGGDDAFVMKFSPDGTLRFSTYLGSDGIDDGEGVALLDDGTIVVGGETRQVTAGGGFPTTVGAFQPAPSSAAGNVGDGFVSRINPSVTPAAFVFSTFLGGAGTDSVIDLDADASGIYLVGFTNTLGANGFPTTAGAFQTMATASGDGFVTKMDLQGASLLYSTLIGGSMGDQTQEVAVDEAGRAWVSMFTQSTDLPVCAGAANPCAPGSPPPYQSAFNSFVDVFVLRVDATGSTISYGSYLGGNNDDRANDLDYNATTRRVVLVGHTDSSDFPTTANAAYPNRLSTGSQMDGWALRLNATSGAADYATYYGAGGADSDAAAGVALDDEWGIHIVGDSYDASASFPRTPNRVQPGLGGMQDGYLAIIGKVGPTAVLRAQAPGHATVTVDPFTGIYTVPAGTGVQLDVLLSQAGDFPLNLTANWFLYDGHGPLAPLPSPAPASTITWSRGNGQRGTACATVWDTDPVGTFDRSDTKCLRIQWLNTGPSAADDALAVAEDGGAQALLVLANDSDPDGDPLTIVGASAVTLRPDQGTFGWSASQLTFTPGPHYYNQPPPGGVADPVRIDYTVSDPYGATDTASVAVLVSEVNDPPVAVDDSATTPEDTAVDLDLLANDHSGPDPPETLALTVLGAPSGGALVDLGGGQVRFTPPADVAGTFTFPYTIDDGRGGTDSATATVFVNATNDPPLADDDAFGLTEDVPADLDLLADDLDPEGDALQVVAVTPAAHGTVTLLAGGLLVRYVPDAHYAGADGFTYTVSDGRGGTDTAAVALALAETNDPPVAVADAVTVEEDSADNEFLVLANDHDGPDSGETLFVVSVGPASSGTATLSGGRVLYTPDPGHFGPDAFTYTVSDGRGATASAAVAVTVRPENLAPLPQDDAVVAIPGVPDQCFDVLANDADPDGPRSALRLVGLLSGPDAVPADAFVAADGLALCSHGAVPGRAVFRQTVSDGDRSGEAAVDLLVGLPATPRLVLERLSPPPICAGEDVLFRAYAGHAGRTVESWRWTFAGTDTVVPASGALDQRAHAFAAGAAVVSVEARLRPDAGGALELLTASLPVAVAGCRAPGVAFDALPDGLRVEFDATASDPEGTPLTYLWTFGDGASSFATDPVHDYAAPGAYRVRLTVTDGEGLSSTAERTVFVGLRGGNPPGGATAAPSADVGGALGAAAPAAPVNRRPVAVAAGPADAPAGGAAVLDGSASSDPDGDALAFAWEQVGGAPVVLLRADTARPSFVMPDAGAAAGAAGIGTLRFRLTVHDGQAFGRDEVEVRVAPADDEAAGPTGPAAPRFTVQPGDAPLSLRFTALRDPADGSGVTYAWSFGDGATATGAEATHAYPEPGAYVVRLRVEADGQAREAVQTVQVEGEAAQPQSLPERPAQAARFSAVTSGLLVALALAAVVLATVLWAATRRR